MTVPVQVPSTTIISVLNQTIFPFNFRCDDAATIHTFINDVESFTGVVALNGDQGAAPGGTVTLPAQPAGVSVTIERQSTQQQTVAVAAYGPFPSAAVMTALDRLVMLVQDAFSRLSRTIKVTRANLVKLSTLDLPLPSLGGLLGWVDAGGGLLKLGNIVGSGTPVSGEVVARTGPGTYQLANVPLAPLSQVQVYLNGARLTKDTHYTITSTGGITQLAGFISDPAEVMLADYLY